MLHYKTILNSFWIEDHNLAFVYEKESCHEDACDNFDRVLPALFDTINYGGRLDASTRKEINELKDSIIDGYHIRGPVHFFVFVCEPNSWCDSKHMVVFSYCANNIEPYCTLKTTNYVAHIHEGFWDSVNIPTLLGVLPVEDKWYKNEQRIITCAGRLIEGWFIALHNFTEPLVEWFKESPKPIELNKD